MLPRHIPVAGQDSSWKAMASAQVGSASGPREARGGCIDDTRFKKICEAEGPGSKTALQGPSFKAMAVGERFLFKPLECFFLAQEVKTCFI